MKTCPKCQQTKPSSDYSKKRSAKDGLFYCCKDCWKEHSKEYSTNNRDKIAEYQKEHRARPEVKERYNEWQREQYKNRQSFHNIKGFYIKKCFLYKRQKAFF